MKLFLLVFYLAANLVWQQVCYTPQEAALIIELDKPHTQFEARFFNHAEYRLYEIDLETVKEIEIPEIVFK